MTGDELKAIALKHNTVVAGSEFADKFDWNAITVELAAPPHPLLREQIEHCFAQATQGTHFSKAYCIDRLMELFATSERESCEVKLERER